MGTTSEAVAGAVRAGRFIDAAQLLKHADTQLPEVSVLALETFYYLGESERTRVAGRRLLDSSMLTAGQAARCAHILASQYWDDGDLKETTVLCQKSLELARTANDRIAACWAAAKLLEHTYDSVAFDASLPLATQARRVAVGCGDPQSLAVAHVTFARLEARAGHFETATRHIQVCRNLVADAPTLLLSAAVDVCESTLLGLLGDNEAALQLAKRAVTTASEAGWAKGIVAAAANAGHILAVMDRRSEAEEFLRTAERQRFMTIRYQMAIGDTRIRLAARAGQYENAYAILSELESRGGSASEWYSLSLQSTKVQLLIAQERWEDALELAEASLPMARQAGLPTIVSTVQLQRAEALLALGRTVPSDQSLPTNDRTSLSYLGTLWLTLGRSFGSTNQPARAQAYLRRAAHAHRATGASDDGPGSMALDAGTDAADTLALETDAAAALFDLASYPKAFGFEALDILDSARCANGCALISTVGTNKRVLECKGWDERAALIALRKGDGIDRIRIGEHRGELLEIIARPNPDLQHRSTFDSFQKLVTAAIELDRYRREEKKRAALWPPEALDNDPESIWASEQMSEILKIARRIAPTPSLTILLTGETGTGKEMLARAIHRASERADKTLLPFNCTAVPKDMLDSQLFGYRKGAFTGAETSFPGVIRSAAGGTLFLDEIAEIPLDVQPKLLRFLETHEIHPLGEPQPIKVDVRIVAATNANLEQLVAEGRFREDLFYRLNVVRLKLPPLRERREEIPPLVEHYMRKFADEQKKGRLTLADETLEYLLLYSWPGNLRQLANEVRRMVAMAEADSTLTPALLSPEIQASRRTIPVAAASSAEPEVRVRLDQPLPAAVEMLEQTMIRSALIKSRGRVEEAAKLLGISRKGLFLKRRRWNLDSRQAS